MVKLILFVVFVHGVLSLTSASPDRQHYRKRSPQKPSSKRNSKATQGVERDEQLNPVNVLDTDQVGHVIPIFNNPNSADALASSPENKVITVNGKVMDSQVLKLLLKNLMTKLESRGTNVSSKSQSQQTGGPRRMRSPKRRHCNLHGLWLSIVAGAAIELIPDKQHGHIGIQAKIFDLPDNPFPSVINSQWTGKGMISPESPTTITVIFQEHIDAEAGNHAKEREGDDSPVFIQLPRTAVFVGQCLICQGNPMLQGSWLIFPVTQTCNAASGLTPITKDEFGNMHPVQLKDPNIPDFMYLLR
ncbi:hypothetical protein Ocin01_03128 [Orchesella cincta]|uniref:Uncharacterized protein n=1 Tax=Orchesella cincta TaxID=48709 RepID=A0A1D2NE81_ORCCI|nr:hypothetical protein Ocin01_03128 [Orchesella cincta]